MDPEKGILLRGSAESRLNPCDAVAIEAALRLREEVGGRVHALSMGPPEAEKSLQYAYAMGADGMTLLTDPAFAGADVLATARTLAMGIRALGGADVILFGRQTTDGDTGQVGPSVAAFLDIPCVCRVRRIRYGDSGLLLVQSVTGGEQTVRPELPCAVAVDKDCCAPRLPPLKRKLSAGKQRAARMTAADFPGAASTAFGLAGSATRVVKIYPPRQAALGRRIEGTVPQQAAVIAEAVRGARGRGDSP